MSTNQAEGFFSEFPSVSKTEWEELIKNDLNGADYRETLKWDTLEGFSIAPFFTRDDFLKKEFVAPTIQTSKWMCCEWITDSSPTAANRSIKKALEGGADACLIRSRITAESDESIYKISGVSVQSVADMELLIDGIDPHAELIFDCGMAAPATLAMLRNCGKNLNPVSAVFDPLTEAAKTGCLPAEKPELKLIIENLSEYSGHDILCADASFYHNAGSSITWELGIALAIGSDYLAMVGEPFRLKTAENMFLRLGIGPLFFPEIAKFRAIRILWPKMLHAWGIVKQSPLRIFAETGKTNKPITDPHNNLLRSVSEAMSAVIGGADLLMVHPFDTVTGDSGPNSLRLARNIQHILREEARFSITDDPSSGSYYIEYLTDTIARKAWEAFQLIEREGGFLQSLKNGLIQQQVQQSKEIKEKAYHSVRRVLTGTNQYANPGEKLRLQQDDSNSFEILQKSSVVHEVPKVGLHRLNLDKAVGSGATLGDLLYGYLKPGKERFLPIPGYRAGAVFDEIRLRTEAQTAKSGRRPSAWLIPAGNPKWRNARAQFAQQVFACAGFEVTRLKGADHLDEVLSETDTGTADLYILCSSDKEYEILTEPFCKRFSGKGLLVMAGKPAGKEETFRQAGINDFIFKWMNLPGFLKNIQDSLFGQEEKI